jgi:glycine reductase
MSYKVLYYVNQFFGQVGGEDKAGMAPVMKDEKVGPALGFDQLMGEEAEVVGTIICGDNYFNENNEEAVKFIIDAVSEKNPDLVVAGPAFNAGRYGMACAGVAKVVADELNIPVITGMYGENPGLEIARTKSLVVETNDSAAGMKDALAKMADLAKKMIKGEKLGYPEDEGYFAQGKRLTVFSDKRGSERAVEMLLARFKGEEFKSELPMPVFDRVAPAAAIKDLSKANSTRSTADTTRSMQTSFLTGWHHWICLENSRRKA